MGRIKIDLDYDRMVEAVEEGFNRAIKPYVTIGFIFGIIYMILQIARFVCDGRFI